MLVDSKIGDLPRAKQVDDDSLLVMEQQGGALAVEGKLIADFARESVAADVQKAVNAAGTAQSAADRAVTARDSIVQSELNAIASASSAATSAANAATSEGNAKRSETAAESAANRAQAEAERVSVPAAAGVYNMILTDRVTGERYALIVENGRPALLGVSQTLNATEMTLIDSVTGTAYELLVESGRLNLKEV